FQARGPEELKIFLLAHRLRAWDMMTQLHHLRRPTTILAVEWFLLALTGICLPFQMKLRHSHRILTGC
ncbi:hypothetical protein NL472_27740, partial [Klebsiella pneumoniae]|nr:hypothetical protein [Klebsiella pneumoniae]